MGTLLRFVLVFVAASLCACSSLPERLETAPSFMVGPDVKLPEASRYAGLGTAIARLRGTPGVIVTGTNPDGDTSKILNDYLAANGIDLRPLLIDAFSAEVRKTVAGSRLKTTAEHRIAFEVESYGLGKIEGFADITRPMIRVKIMLVTPSGATLWERTTDTVGPDAKVIPAKDLDGWLSDPAALKSAFAEAAALVCRRALANLDRAPGA